MAQKNLRSCGRWQGRSEKKKKTEVAEVTLETVNSSVGINTAIVRATVQQLRERKSEQ